MQNPCLNVAVIITSGAVFVFFAVIGYFTRAAYFNGFAAGFTAARERFKRIIQETKTRDIFEDYQDEIERGAP